MRIIFLRHGQDDESRRGGWSKLGLLEEGKRQAKMVAEYFRDSSAFDVRYILSSDLPRAMETAEYVSEAIGVSVHADRSLREMNNGDLAGMLNTEACSKYPGLYFNALDMDEAYPNGESPRAFYRRIRDWLNDFLENPPVSEGDVLAVTHGGVINILYYLTEKLDWTNKKPSVPADKCSIHALNVDTMSFDVRNGVVWK